MQSKTIASESAQSLAQKGGLSGSRVAIKNFLKECKLIVKDTNYSFPSPRCFISYAWEQDVHKNEHLQKRLEILKDDLQKLGVIVQLDIRNMQSSLTDFMKQGIETSDYIFLIGTPRLKERLSETGDTLNNAQYEFEEIKKKWATNLNCLLPLLLDGDFGTAFPQEILRNLIRDCRQVADEWQNPAALTPYARTLGALSNPLGLIPILFNTHQHDNKNVIKRYQAAWEHLAASMKSFDQQSLRASRKLTSAFSAEQANQLILSRLGKVNESDHQRLLDLFSHSRLQLEQALQDIKQSGDVISAYCEAYQLRSPIKHHLSDLAAVEPGNHAALLTEWQLAISTMDSSVSRDDIKTLSTYLDRLGAALLHEGKGYADIMACYLPWLDHPNTDRQRWFDQLAATAHRVFCAKNYLDAKFLYQEVLGFFEQPQQQKTPPTAVLEKLAKISMLMGDMGAAMLYAMYWKKIADKQHLNVRGKQQCTQLIATIQDAAFIYLVQTHELCNRHFGLTVKTETDKQSQLIPLIKTLESCGHRLWVHAAKEPEACPKNYYYEQATACYQSILDLFEIVKELSVELKQLAATFISQVKHRKPPPQLVIDVSNQPTISPWEILQQSLQPLRQNLTSADAIEEDNNKTNTTTLIVDALQQLFGLAESVLGATPWPYAVMGLGSLARGEACPYSDLEFAIVLKDTESDAKPDAVHHLKAMMQWMELQLIALGETEQAVIWPSSQGNSKINLPVIPGFRFDEGGNIPFGKKGEPGGRKSEQASFLVDTADKLLAETFKLPEGGHIPGDMIIANALQGAAYLWGDKDCAEAFRIQLFKRLSQHNTHQYLALHLLNDHFENQEFNITIDDNTQQIDIKKNFLRLPTFIIETLALYAGINETNSTMRLIKLVEKNYLSQAMADALLICLYFGLELRTQAHRHYGREHDTIYFKPPDTIAKNDTSYVLSPEQNQWLKIFHHTRLLPSKELVKNALLPDTNSPEVLAKQTAVFQDLLQNTTLYQQALQNSPKLVQQLRQHALELRSYGRFEEALLLSRFSLLIDKDLDINKAYQAFSDACTELMKRCDATDNPHEKLRLRDQLMHVPEANGVRASTLYKQRRWQTEVLAITEPSADKIPPDQLGLEGLHCGKRLLNAQVSAKLVQGLLNKPNAYGTHSVINIDFGAYSFYFKLYPEYPGNEKAAYLLMERVVGGGAPESELCQLTDSRGTSYPVLVSRTIPGKNIKEHYSNSVEDKLKTDTQKKEAIIHTLKKIDAERFSRLFIAALLTSNEDGKTDNIMLHKQYNVQNSASLKTNTGDALQTLTFIDNERCFLPAVATVDKKNELQMKQFLFCMDQMNASIHESVRQEINRLESYRLLNDWLDELGAENHRCVTVFGQEKIRQYSNLSDPSKGSHRFFKPAIDLPEHPVILPVVFVNEAEERLFAKLRYLKILWEKHPGITQLELLHRLEPMAFKSYRQAIADTTSKDSLSRWKILEEKYYQVGEQGAAISTIKGTTIAMQTLAIKTKQSLGQLMQGDLNCCYAPGMSKHRLLRHYQIHTIQEELKRGQTTGFMQLMTDTMRKQVLEEMPFKSIPLETQTVIFKAVQDICFTHLVIKNAEGLTDNLLKSFLKSSGEYLVSIRLENCSRLTDTSINNMALYCPNLQSLSLSGLTGLNYIQQKTGFLQRSPTNAGLSFPVLARLKIQGCQNLKQIELWSPMLKLTQIELNDHAIKPEVLVRWVQFLYTQSYKTNSPLLEKTYAAVTVGEGTLDFLKTIRIVGAAGLVSNFSEPILPNKDELLYFTQLLRWDIPVKRVNVKAIDFKMEQKKPIRIALLGDIEVGKHSLLRRLVEDGFEDGKVLNHYNDEIGYTLPIFANNNVELELNISLPDSDRFSPIWGEGRECALPKIVNIYILCADCTNEESIRDLEGYWKECERYGNDHGIKIIVLTKVDLTDKAIVQLGNNCLTGFFAGADQLPYFECSAATGEGVEELFRSAVLLYLKSQNKLNPFIEILRRDFPAISIESDDPLLKGLLKDTKPLGTNILDLVMRADLEGVEAQIKTNPKLLYGQSDITDLSEQSFKGITAFQYAAWLCDRLMCEMILRYLPKEKAAKQLDVLEKHPERFSVYGSQIDFSLLITQYNDYLEKHTNWDYKEQKDWIKGFGEEQYKMPMWYAYKFMEEGRAWIEQNTQQHYGRTATKVNKWYSSKGTEGYVRGEEPRWQELSRILDEERGIGLRDSLELHRNRLEETKPVDYCSLYLEHDRKMTELEKQAADAYRQELRQRLLGDTHPQLSAQSLALASVGLFSSASSSNSVSQAAVQPEREEEEEQPSDNQRVLP